MGITRLTCEVCGKEYMGEEPIGCCSGRECGCMGLPINGPFICSEECYEVWEAKKVTKLGPPPNFKEFLREAYNLKEGEKKKIWVTPIKGFNPKDIGKKFWVALTGMQEVELWRLYELVHIRSGVAFIKDVETNVEKFIVEGSIIFSLNKVEPEKYVTVSDPDIYNVISRSGKVIISYI